MWEDLTVALCGIGFIAAVGLLLVELPAVLNPKFVAWRRLN
jgi:hypothetical protein